ncbi:MAG: kynureninase [Flavobacteriales bacterium]|jgi:kynureninase|nr:kynureninase [Flavobacteriales bacterium]
MSTFENSLAFAQARDTADPLRAFRTEFHFPQHDGRDVLYFTGNSLGLQPKAAADALKQELDDWARLGVEGHFQAKHPWYSYHEELTPSLARLVGALPEEVVAMNQLTSNLHFLMVSFYRPSGKPFDSPSTPLRAGAQGRRKKILTEQRPFPSDTYAFASQVAFHGGDPATDLIEVQPRAGEHTLRTEDIIATINALGEELALVCFGGVNFYTGQAFDMAAITQAAHAVGATAGFDLAHAAGNLHLHLHDWNVDFACWCSYKYLNSGPGSVAGAFVHQRHLQPPQGLPTKEGTLRSATITAGSLSGDPTEVYLGNGLPLFAGWWGHDKSERFKMERTFKPMPTAEAWQVSNAPVFSMAVHRVALELFDRAGIANLRAKSEQLTGYLAFIIAEVAQRTGTQLEVITPTDPMQRGCQLSILAHGHGKALFNRITDRGVVADWREPNVIRMAPVPMYNSFEDVWRFGQILNECLVGVH